MVKKREEIKQIIHPPDDQHAEKWVELIYNDGSRAILDSRGKPLNAIAITSEQIALWQKMPKEQATEAILKLIDDQGLDVSEKRFILDAIKTLAELHGATQPVSSGGNIVVQINMGNGGEKKIIPIQAQAKSVSE